MFKLQNINYKFKIYMEFFLKLKYFTNTEQNSSFGRVDEDVHFWN